MEGQDNLFDLIKSLSKSEKGYFKKVNSFHIKGEQNNYMLLFDAIDKMEKYDEAAFKRLLPERVNAQLSYLKHYLYYQLLDSLDQYYRSSNVEINKWICKAEILYKKGLAGQAQKIIEKARDFAFKKEKFAYLLQLTRLRFEYLTEEENIERILFQNEALQNELKELQDKIDNLYIYFQLRIQLNILRMQTGYARNKEQILKFKAFLEHPALSNHSIQLSNSARYHFYTIRAIVFDYMHKYEKAYDSCKKVLELFESFPILFEEGISAKILTLHRKCTIACTLGKFKEALEDIANLRSLKTGHTKYLAQIFQYGYHQEFQVLLWTGKFDDLLEKVPCFEEEYQRHYRSISKTFELRILAQISEAFFISGQYEKSLEWITMAINAMPPGSRNDLVSGIKLHEILTHVELGNIRVVKSKVSAAEKYMRTKRKPYRFEQYMLSFLEKYADCPKESERVRLLDQAQEVMEKFFVDRSENVPLKYFYMRAWVESKIRKRPLSTLLKQQLHQYYSGKRQEIAV